VHTEIAVDANLKRSRKSSYSWVNRTEEIEKDGKTVKVSKTIQEEQQLTVGQLITDTTEQLKKKLTRHVFNIRHQFNSPKTLKDTIDETEAVLHVDFSENYNCKLAEEIQAMHFGGSRSQASLHTLYCIQRTLLSNFVQFQKVPIIALKGSGHIWIQYCNKYVQQCPRSSVCIS
jgi:short subunit dehydrogenase-like uncharacterized protein